MDDDQMTIPDDQTTVVEEQEQEQQPQSQLQSQPQSQPQSQQQPQQEQPQQDQQQEEQVDLDDELIETNSIANSEQEIIVIEPPTCWGCIENQPNQLAHMDPGGCLYFDESV